MKGSFKLLPRLNVLTKNPGRPPNKMYLPDQVLSLGWSDCRDYQHFPYVIRKIWGGLIYFCGFKDTF